MNLGLSKTTLGIIAIIAGVLVLAVPDLLRWILGIFLIILGAMYLLGRK